MGKKISLVNDNPQCPDAEWFTVRWYNPFKGFGFVTKAEDPNDTSFEDIFLHFSVLEALDLLQVRQGDRILGTIIDRPDGRQICEVFDIKQLNPFLADNEHLQKGRKVSPPRFMIKEDNLELKEVDAIVKWYSRVKGFGFAQINAKGKDIFIHGAVLEKENIETLKPGQKVKLWVTLSESGLEARKINLLSK